MAGKAKPTIIKKYANRRLYNTGSSSYVTLEDLAVMVKNGEEFEVQDAKTGEDLTRPVLAQIIFEQEAKEGQNLLPVAFLRQLISYYGDSMQAMVPSYLEYTMKAFAEEQDKLREQMSDTFEKMGMPGISRTMDFTAKTVPGLDMKATEELVRKNTEMFQKTMGMFMPYAAGLHNASEGEAKSNGEAEEADLDSLKKQISEMQEKIDKLT